MALVGYIIIEELLILAFFKIKTLDVKFIFEQIHSKFRCTIS
jgi:hypothetical protein